MPINPKLLAAARAHKATKGKNPSPTANDVQNPTGSEADFPGEGKEVGYEDASPEPGAPENPALAHKAKAAKHLGKIKEKAKGALAVHAKLALHHHNAYCKAMGH